MSALPCSAVPILPSAVAAAARTSASGSCTAVASSDAAGPPPRMPIAYAESARMLFCSSRRVSASPLNTAGDTAVYGGTEARSYSSENACRKRSIGPPRSRSA